MKTIDANSYSNAANTRVNMENGKIELHNGYDWAGDVKLTWSELLAHWDDIEKLQKPFMAQLLHYSGCPLHLIPEYRSSWYSVEILVRNEYTCGCVVHTNGGPHEISDALPRTFYHTGSKYDWHHIIHYGKKLKHEKHDHMCDECKHKIDMENAEKIHQEKIKNAIWSKTAKINGSGSDRWKSVTCLTVAEKQHIDNGGYVLIKYTPWASNQSGVKRVIKFNNKYTHREL